MVDEEDKYFSKRQTIFLTESFKISTKITIWTCTDDRDVYMEEDNNMEVEKEVEKEVDEEVDKDVPIFVMH